MRFRRLTFLAGSISIAALLPHARAQQPVASAGVDWPLYRHDFRGSGYSPLAQIDTTNVGTLTQKWTFRLQPDAPAPATAAGGGRGAGGALNSAAPPILRPGVLHVPAPRRGPPPHPLTRTEVPPRPD